MVKIYGYFITAIVLLVLGFSTYILRESNKRLQEENKTLRTTIESNLKAARDKEERSKDELERLQKTIAELHKLNSACLSDDVNPDTIKFLQYLQQNYSGSISFTFAK